MRGALRYLFSSLLVGALSIGLAWAGAGLVPVNSEDPVKGVTGQVSAEKQSDEETPLSPVQVAPGQNPQAGYVLAGASKVPITPMPGEGETWETNMDKCRTLDAGFYERFPDYFSDATAHIASAGSPWPENPNCIYMGGYGIGPMNPITSIDETGFWVRSAAVKGSNGKTLVTTIIDGEGYFWDYKNKCDDCGVKQLSASIAGELGIDPAGIVIASTHSHTAPDFIGGWGFVPDWYMEQVSGAIRESITKAVTTMQPAILETGEELARDFNGERRSTYRSAEEQELTWLRAVALNGQSGEPHPSQPETVFTIGAYAAHPVTRDADNGVGHADWPGLFERTIEQRFGGVGLLFMTGLGNISPRHPHRAHEKEGGEFMGRDLAGLVPGVGGGIRLAKTEVGVARTTWSHPVTNAPLTALGAPGFFDRRFLEMPAEIRTGKDPNKAQCVSASAMSVELPVSAARIGNAFAISAAPGEIFSNVSNTIKEKSGAVVTMPIGQANDALGYMPQSFEMSQVAQQGLGFADPIKGYVLVNYEDSYAIDKCVGDAVLEKTISLFSQIGF
jgi:hypothetical protein